MDDIFNLTFKKDERKKLKIDKTNDGINNI